MGARAGDPAQVSAQLDTSLVTASAAPPGRDCVEKEDTTPFPPLGCGSKSGLSVGRGGFLSLLVPPRCWCTNTLITVRDKALLNLSLFLEDCEGYRGKNIGLRRARMFCKAQGSRSPDLRLLMPWGRWSCSASSASWQEGSRAFKCSLCR